MDDIRYGLGNREGQLLVVEWSYEGDAGHTGGYNRTRADLDISKQGRGVEGLARGVGKNINFPKLARRSYAAPRWREPLPKYLRKL